MKYSTPRASPRRENGNGSFVAFVAAREGSERRDGVSFVTRRRSSGFERARSPTTPTRSSSTSSPPPPPRTAVTPHRARRKETLTIHLILRRIYTLHRARSRLRLARPDSHSFDAFMDATRFMYLVTDDAKSSSSVLARIDTSARASPRPHSSSDRAFTTAVILALDRRPNLASPSRASSTSRVAHPRASRIVRTHSLY